MTSSQLCCPLCRSEVVPSATGCLLCVGCHTEFVVFDGVPILMPAAVQANAKVKEFFDGVAGDLDRGKVSYVPFEAPQLDRHLRILSRAFQRSLTRWLAPGSSILDVGCGHGALLESVSDSFLLTGVDFAFDMLPLARDRGYAVYQADAAALPFKDAQFDAVVCAEVFQHFHDVRPIVTELARVVRPGGSMIISTLNRSSVMRMLLRFMKKAMRPSAFPVPILRRSAVDVLHAAEEFPMAFREVAWVLSPTPLVVFGSNASTIMSAAATNFIICLTKS